MADNDSEKKNTITRPPVAVILGHVDHGKTAILDYIRKSKIVEGEAGGITQHIGAYQVEVPEGPKSASGGLQNNKTITFLDTPGHEAFSAIRSRGAKVADIAVLVVAADEGVKPQTKEAIKILQESKIPFITAINKIDKPEANSQKVKQELSENGVTIEEWGGKIPVVEVSAKTGQGIDNLLEMILLLAELEELSANPLSSARGVVIESHLDSQKGNMATLLVLDGTLNLGEWVVAGNSLCKVKSMENFIEKDIKEARPGAPVVVLGWNSAPQLGQEFEVVSSRSDAEKKVKESTELGKSELFIYEEATEKTSKRTFNLIIKADVRSSLEAIDQALKSIKSDEVEYRVLGYGVGNISDSDVKMAISSKAVIIGFYTEIGNSVKMLAEKEKIEIATFDIIYELVEKVREKMEAMLEPEIKKNILGRVKILAIFKREEKSQVIGGKVTSGKVKRGAMIEVIRDDNPLMIGRLGQLQHNKADVEEVKEGLECGIRFDMLREPAGPASPSLGGPMLPIKEGDILEIYKEEKIKRSLG